MDELFLTVFSFHSLKLQWFSSNFVTLAHGMGIVSESTLILNTFYFKCYLKHFIT